MIVALLVSTGAAWEADALQHLSDHPGTVVLKRCVDVDDLLAAASTGQAQVAVLGVELTGLDAGVVAELTTAGVQVVAVSADVDAGIAHATRIGIKVVVPVSRLDELADIVAAGAPFAAGPPAPPTVIASASPTMPGASARGRVVAVWGPSGGPGRTTIATGLAAEIARRQLPTLLVDADPYGGSVAQQLGILDEVSGLLSAARLAASGSLAAGLGSVQRQMSSTLRVLTGLPRTDRWAEIRPGALTDVVGRAREEAQVVIDTGFSIEPDPAVDITSARPERNGLTREALEVADDVVLVGSADPVGLTRLARAVADIHDNLSAPRVRLVINRMRPSLGWRESDVASMLAGFGPSTGVHFLPEDQPAVDKALVAGRTLLEVGESPLTRAIAQLVDAMAGRPAR